MCEYVCALHALWWQGKNAFYDVPSGLDHQHMSIQKSHFCLMLSAASSSAGRCLLLHLSPGSPHSLWLSIPPNPLLDMSGSSVTLLSLTGRDLFFVPLWPISSQRAHLMEMNVANCLLTKCIFVFQLTADGERSTWLLTTKLFKKPEAFLK